MSPKFIAFIVCVLSASTALASDCAEVFFVTFDAELYTPKTEETIEATAFEHLYIPSEYLESITGPASRKASLEEYEPGNTRAFIKHGGRSYFIDRDGILRAEDKFFKIDSYTFEKSLLKSCK